MAETTSHVYDLAYPSPVTLKEISTIAVVVELWREKIASSGEKTLNEFDLDDLIPLKEVIPNVPSVIYDLLDEYMGKFRLSIAQWLAYHSGKVFGYSLNEILSNSSDFARDWNGAIHYIRTAKRMMLCDRLADGEKFRIACLYCFENDIKRIWPHVSAKMDLNDVDFDQCPLLYYWICCLRNELHKVPNSSDDPIDEVMLNTCEYNNYSSAEYFWNRIPAERQSQAAIIVSISSSELFTRFILPKLNELQLEEFLAVRGADLIESLLIHSLEKILILPTWMYIKNKIKKSNFVGLIEKLLEEETNYFIAKERLNSRDETYLCCEIWKTAPQNLKRPALDSVLSNNELFHRTGRAPSEPREMRFLITILLDASFEQRSAFWNNTWRNLISGARIEDLLGVMKLCFWNDNEISLFKETVLSKYENIRPYCVQLLEYGCFKELKNFLSFCYSDEQKRIELKQRLLRSNFLDENSILRFEFVCNPKEFNEFIEDAFENTDIRVEFKNQFISSPVTENYLFDCIRLGFFGCLIGFVNIFVSEEQALVLLKNRLLNDFKECLNAGTIWQMNVDNLQKILVWFLGNEDEVSKFKQTLSVRDIFCNMIQFELENRDDDDDGDDSGVPLEYPERLENFLKWYFNKTEEIEEFKGLFSDKLKVFAPRE